jgi:hypothetical protein
MTRKLLSSISIATALLFTQPAHASGQLTGMELVNLCMDENKAVQTICRSFLLGALGTWELSQKLHDTEDCIPSTKSPEMQRVFIEWAKKNHEHLEKSAATTVILSQLETYPCKSARKG